MQLAEQSGILAENIGIESTHLKRKVEISLYIPPTVTNFSLAHLLLINDGQNMEELGLGAILKGLSQDGEIKPLICAAISAGMDRKMEYGVAGIPDFKGRGEQAGHYTSL
jgi:enterochelin esterase-like enzyme